MSCWAAVFLILLAVASCPSPPSSLSSSPASSSSSLLPGFGFVLLVRADDTTAEQEDSAEITVLGGNVATQFRVLDALDHAYELSHTTTDLSLIPGGSVYARGLLAKNEVISSKIFSIACVSVYQLRVSVSGRSYYAISDVPASLDDYALMPDILVLPFFAEGSV